MSDILQIRESELQALLDNEETAEQALATYFDVDDSTPFAPVYTLKPEVELLGEPGERAFGLRDAVVAIANALSRRSRVKRYAQIVEQHPDRLRLIAEGDSWFEHPLVEDTIDHLFNHYAVYSVGAGGDELGNMFQQNEYLSAIEAQGAQGLLLSGGGNDLLGDRFASYLKEFSPGCDPRRFLTDEFFARVQDMIRIYETIFDSMLRLKPEVPIFCHGYDFVIPQGKEGKWLGQPMGKKGITDPEDQRAIIHTIIDEFDGQMAALAGRFENVVFVDLRGTVREDHWHDEIYPDSPGFQQVALKFIQAINAALLGR
jgi:hypothetical protein